MLPKSATILIQIVIGNKKNTTMNLISYWSEVSVVHIDEGLVLITGKYNHKNKNSEGQKSLGVHWGAYPQSRGVLSPCVIPESTRNGILSGILHQAVANKNAIQIKNIITAINYFN